MSDMMKDCEATIGRLIDKQTTAFISSVDPDGFPNTKAMLSPRKRIGIQTFYFTTNTSSMRSAQYRENPKACIYFCDKRYFRGVMLIGTAEILEDTKSREMIWREGDTMYYPESNGSGLLCFKDYCNKGQILFQLSFGNVCCTCCETDNS